MIYVFWIILLMSFGMVCGMIFKYPWGLIVAGVGGWVLGPILLKLLGG